MSMEAVRQLLVSAQPVKWVFTGDSITHGALHTFGWRDYVELFAERVRPNECGHRAFALNIYQTLGIYDASSHSCRLHLP